MQPASFLSIGASLGLGHDLADQEVDGALLARADLVHHFRVGLDDGIGDLLKVDLGLQFLGQGLPACHPARRGRVNTCLVIPP